MSLWKTKGLEKPHIYPYPEFPGWWIVCWQSWVRVGDFQFVCKAARDYWDKRVPDNIKQYDVIDGIPVRYKQ